MKRSMTLIAVVCGMCVLAASASAGQKHRKNSDGNNSPNAFVQQFGQGRLQQLTGGNPGLQSLFTKKHHKNDKPDDRVPIDPGKGDGQTGNPAPPSMPGYVWVGDHWERERAPKTVAPPTTPTTGQPGFVWVGDHWERARAPKSPTVIAPPVVRDHTGTSGGVTVMPTSGGPIVRDHRGDAPVTVFPTSGGPIVRDHRGDAPVTVFPTSGGPIVRDHRGDAPVTVFPTSGGPIVRDHRTLTPWSPSGQGGVTVGPANQGPIVRDHRTASEPVVRDHRRESEGSSGLPFNFNTFQHLFDAITP